MGIQRGEEERVGIGATGGTGGWAKLAAILGNAEKIKEQKERLWLDLLQMKRELEEQEMKEEAGAPVKKGVTTSTEYYL